MPIARCVAKYFVKENSLELFEEQMAKGSLDRGAQMLFGSLRCGTVLGLKNLRLHKTQWDDSLRKQSYQDVEYKLFKVSQEPFMAFSAAFYPEFDFLGRKLQNLADSSRRLDLLTFCSANMQNG